MHIVHLKPQRDMSTGKFETSKILQICLPKHYINTLRKTGKLNSFLNRKLSLTSSVTADIKVVTAMFDEQ